jgi:hypothetical protein
MIPGSCATLEDREAAQMDKYAGVLEGRLKRQTRLNGNNSILAKCIIFTHQSNMSHNKTLQGIRSEFLFTKVKVF